jgi:hypothetical protein
MLPPKRVPQLKKARIDAAGFLVNISGLRNAAPTRKCVRAAASNCLP